MMMLMTGSMMLSLMFKKMKHPLSMGLVLMLQTIIIAMISGMLTNTSWFSYMLLIIMLSGMLVLFIYMSSIASNEKFKISIKMLIMMMITLAMSVIMYFLVDQLSMTSMWSTSKYMMTNKPTSLYKLFNYPNLFMTMVIISYLFMTMVIISYIVSVHEGPLRMKN